MLRIATLCAALIALAACETTKGAGEDIQDLGEAIEGAATNPT
ncbi:entericidin A/B family lipoprotein [uncultured Roseobacter sp.]|nr:entericidin A/B family lipoprotein [uncultured Roseobacter sp.]